MDTPEQASGRKVGLCFRAAALCCALFIFTVLALTATAFSEPAAPAARWLNQYGTRLVAAEAVLTIVFGIAALFADQRQIRADRSSPAEQERGTCP